MYCNLSFKFFGKSFISSLIENNFRQLFLTKSVVINKLSKKHQFVTINKAFKLKLQHLDTCI